MASLPPISLSQVLVTLCSFLRPQSEHVFFFLGLWWEKKNFSKQPASPWVLS